MKLIVIMWASYITTSNNNLLIYSLMNKLICCTSSALQSWKNLLLYSLNLATTIGIGNTVTKWKIRWPWLCFQFYFIYYFLSPHSSTHCNAQLSGGINSKKWINVFIYILCRGRDYRKIARHTIGKCIKRNILVPTTCLAHSGFMSMIGKQPVLLHYFCCIFPIVCLLTAL